MAKKQKKQLRKKKPKSIISGLKTNVRMDSLKHAKAPRVRKELLDADYLDKLSKDELKWYAQFTDEWTAGAVSKTSSGTVKRGHLHKSNQLAKELYDANNRRNNDVHGVTQANHLLMELNMVIGEKNEDLERRMVSNVDLTELAVISGIDRDQVSDEEILTRYQFLKLIKGGVFVPEDVKLFYIEYYKIKPEQMKPKKLKLK